MTMQVNWKTDAAQPVLFRNLTRWTGIELKHARVLPGELQPFMPRCHELNMALEGSIRTRKQTSAGRELDFRERAGEMCLTAAGQSMTAAWEHVFEYVAFDIDPDFMVRTAIEYRFSPRFELREDFAGSDPLMQQIGHALLKESKAENSAGSLYAESLIQTLVMHLLKNYSTAARAVENVHGGLAGYKLKSVTDYINDNLSEDITLAEIAAIAGLSRFHFARAFRRSTGFTPQQYLMKQRVERAKALLKDRALPLAEIGLLAGFKNQSHFTALFRKFTNLTPKVWREARQI